MSRKRTKTVVIGYRDRELFSYLYEVKVATASQINRDIFPGLTKAVVYRRLKKLIYMKHLKRCLYFNGERAISGYSLSKAGLLKFILHNRDDHTLKRCLSDSIEHDIILGDIRHLFLNCEQTTDYLTENAFSSSASFVNTEELKQFKSVRPDGVAIVQKGKRFHIAVEYENTLKYSHRYSDLFWRYHFSENIAAVIYICRDKKVLKRVMAVEKKCRENKQSKVYFITLDGLFSNRQCLSFTSSCGHHRFTIH